MGAGSKAAASRSTTGIGPATGDATTAREEFAAVVHRNFGAQSALRVSVKDATGRLRTTLSEGSWPEEADAMSVVRRRPAFERGSDVEIRLPSPAGTVLLLLPVIFKSEPIGMVEILAPTSAVAEHRAALPAFVDSIATTLMARPRSMERVGGDGASGTRTTRVAERAPERVAPIHPVPGVRREQAPRSPDTKTVDLGGIRVLVVHKHKLFAEVIRSVLEELGAEVLQLVEEPSDALAIARKAHPDVVLIDLALNGSAMSLGVELRRECPAARVIGLTPAAGPSVQNEALRCGFHGYLSNDVSLDRFIGSLQATLNGDLVVTREPSSWTPPSRTPDELHAAMLVSHLTRREREVLALLVEGMSGPDMARTLAASPNTVRTHIQSILGKLQVHSRLQAVTFAVENKLVRTPGESSFARRDGTPHPFDIGRLRRRRDERSLQTP